MTGKTAHFVVYRDGTAINTRGFVRNVRFITTVDGGTLDQQAALLAAFNGDFGTKAPSDDTFCEPTASTKNEVGQNPFAAESSFWRPMRKAFRVAPYFIFLLIMIKCGDYVCLHIFKTKCTKFAVICLGPLEARAESFEGNYDYSLNLDAKISTGTLVQIQFGHNEPIYASIADGNDAAAISSANNDEVEIPLTSDKLRAKYVRGAQSAGLIPRDNSILRLRRTSRLSVFSLKVAALQVHQFTRL